jgi:hypothetical protein
MARTKRNDDRPRASRTQIATWIALISCIVAVLAYAGNSDRVNRDLDARVSQLSEEMDYLRLFHELIRPPIHVVSSPPSGKLSRVRIELPTKVSSKWVRGISVCWGDKGNEWIPVDTSTLSGNPITHEYRLSEKPVEYRLSLACYFSGPWVVDCANPDCVISTCVVKASAEGVYLTTMPTDATPLPGALQPHQRALVQEQASSSALVREQASGSALVQEQASGSALVLVGPSTRAQVGWKQNVEVQVLRDTERVTLIVRPHSWPLLYVQGSGRQLRRGVTESFQVTFGDTREQAVGEDFDVMAVIGDSFAPPTDPDGWVLESTEVPFQQAVTLATYSKAAGNLSSVMGNDGTTSPRLKGAIWTTAGGAILMKEGMQYKVLKAFAPSPVGTVFDEPALLMPGDSRSIFLAVCKRDMPLLQKGQIMYWTPTDDRYWVYGCADN